MTAIIYDLYLDDSNERLRELHVTVLCATREGQRAATSVEEALTEQEHVAFRTVYRFSNEDEVDAFDVPAAAARLLR
jgi:hypothetical protein